MASVAADIAAACGRGKQPQDDAVLVHRLPEVFQRETGTALASSKVPLRKWAFAVYLYLTNRKASPA